ncbi:hypothetical protein Droror1_Dr00002569 [Drosera rotundifolia]
MRFGFLSHFRQRRSPHTTIFTAQNPRQFLNRCIHQHILIQSERTRGWNQTLYLKRGRRVPAKRRLDKRLISAAVPKATPSPQPVSAARPSAAVPIPNPCQYKFSVWIPNNHYHHTL